MFALLLPTSSDHDRNRLPVVTLSLIGINVAVDVLANLGHYDQIVKQYGFVAAHPQLHQFFTHMFLHAGWPTMRDASWADYANCLLHIFGNMIYLWFAGSDLEDVLGPVKFILLYLAGGVASALLFWLMAVAGHFPNLDEPAVGASGAISALLGFYLVRFPWFKIRLWFGAFTPIPFYMRQSITRISSVAFIGFWIGLQLILGAQAFHYGGAHVAYWGHIGGFLLGLLVALATRQWRFGNEEYLLKEANYQFYKQRWYPAMEKYQELARRYPHCVTAVTQWALCWDCVGMPARAEKLLQEALLSYQQKGCEAEAAVIEEELDHLAPQSPPVVKPAEPVAAAAHPNLMFRRNFKWKGKSP